MKKHELRPKNEKEQMKKRANSQNEEKNGSKN